MKKLWLLRHGQTQANLEGRFAGRTDEPLTAEGRCQAIEAGKRLAQEPIERIYASPLKRTMETAELVVRGLGRKVEIIPHEAFLEINIPPWEGKKKAEIRRYPELRYELWAKSPHLFCLPGCETLSEVQNRALKAALEILSRDNCALIVTHMVVVRVLLCHFLGLDLSAYRSIPVPNATPILVVPEGDRFRVEAPFALSRAA